MPEAGVIIRIAYDYFSPFTIENRRVAAPSRRPYPDIFWNLG